MTRFTDLPMGIYWEERELYDEQFLLGRVTRTLAGDQLGWMADPFWNEDMHFFDTEEEAKSLLVTMYRMGGRHEPKQRQRVRHAAKGAR
jgi:hypothetical protein